MQRALLRRAMREADRIREKHGTVLNLCLRDYWLPSIASTGKSVDRCYAAGHGSCGGVLTREHYLSASILRQIGEIKGAGIPWLAGRLDVVPHDALTTKCLCKSHNSFLSPLDQMAGQFFGNLTQLMVPGSSPVLIWGPTFERWMLKTLCGVASTKRLSPNLPGELGTGIPAEWIDILLGEKDFIPGHGLYMTPMLGQKITSERGLEVKTLLIADKLSGLEIKFAGITFFLSMVERSVAFNRKHPAYPNILYRPRGFGVDLVDNRVRILWE